MKLNEPIRVLVFGETGVGKTSLCNELTGEKKPVSNQAMGVTLQSQNYLPFIDGDKSFIITDTIGLNESDGGSVRAKDAFRNLMNLIKQSQNGYNIIVHVARGRITKTLHDNYEFFVKTIMQDKVPVILVQTGCENSVPMSMWAEENKQFYEKDGLEYKSILATCFADTQRAELKPIFDKLRIESRNSVLDSIKKYALEESVVLYDSGGFWRFIKKVWNKLCEYFDAETFKISINRSLYELLLRVGFSETEAVELINKLG